MFERVKLPVATRRAVSVLQEEARDDGRDDQRNAYERGRDEGQRVEGVHASISVVRTDNGIGLGYRGRHPCG